MVASLLCLATVHPASVVPALNMTSSELQQTPPDEVQHCVAE